MLAPLFSSSPPNGMVKRLCGNFKGYGNDQAVSPDITIGYDNGLSIATA